MVLDDSPQLTRPRKWQSFKVVACQLIDPPKPSFRVLGVVASGRFTRDLRTSPLDAGSWRFTLGIEQF
jgi:hypothetical protein